MKLNHTVALALMATASACMAPAMAATLPFTVDFERAWDYTNGGIGGYYNGGMAADGSTGGTNLGLDFVNISGLSNDANFTYYSGAPSPLGVAYAYAAAPGDQALINVAGGLSAGRLSFYYASPSAIAGAVKLWSGVDGTGTLLASLDLAATGAAYDLWNQVSVSYGDVVRSIDFTAGANVIALDNLSAVPEPMSAALVALALGAVALQRRRGSR